MKRKTYRHIVLEFECDKGVTEQQLHSIATKKADEVLKSLGQGGLIGGAVYFSARRG